MEQIGAIYRGKYGWKECIVEFTADDVIAIQDAIDVKVSDDTNDNELMHEPIDKRLLALKDIIVEGEVKLTNQNMKDLNTAIVAKVHDLQRDSLEVSAVLADLKIECLEYRNDMNPS